MTWAKRGEDRPRGVPTTTRRRIMRRDEGRCHACGHDGADEVDHLIGFAQWRREQRPGNVNDDSNLAMIHGDTCPTCGQRCHVDKTQRQAAEARWGSRKREERHPGILW